MMHDEAFIKKLGASFALSASPVMENNGRGYRINMYSPWRDNGLNVEYYQVQLCGIDPLTGRDVEHDGIKARFNYSKNSYKTDVLTYHGTFRLRCTAHMSDGSNVLFKEQEIVLNYPANAPYVKYSVSGKGDFKYVEIESNCWANCADKLWLSFNGHTQRVMLQPRHDRTIRFYVPASGAVEVKVQDEMIQVRNGR